MEDLEALERVHDPDAEHRERENNLRNTLLTAQRLASASTQR